MSAVNPVRTDFEAIPAADAVGTSALRKASLRLLPLIGLGYGAAYIDRVNISFASLQMNHDLHFSTYTYGLGAGLFFLSYAVCEVPSNLLLYRFGAKRWLARIMLTWGLLAMGMVFVRTPIQFYVMRFLLGMAEAGYFPGVAFYLMQWFPAYMRARAVSRFYIAVPLASVVMGVLAGALLNLRGTFGFAGWQWLFLVEGLPPIVLSVAFWLFIPSNPGGAKWLTVQERAWLASEIERDSSQGSRHEQGQRTLRDPRIWQLGMLYFCSLAGIYAYVLSAPAILQSATGLSTSKVGFLIALMYLLNAAGMLANARHSDRSRERYLHLAVPLLLMAGSYLIGGTTRSPLLIVLALTVTVFCSGCLHGVFWAIPSSFLKGKSAATGLASINTMAILGGFVGPYWMGFLRDLSGSYRIGLTTLAIPMLAAAGIALVMRHRASKENERSDWDSRRRPG